MTETKSVAMETKWTDDPEMAESLRNDALAALKEPVTNSGDIVATYLKWMATPDELTEPGKVDELITFSQRTEDQLFDIALEVVADHDAAETEEQTLAALDDAVQWARGIAEDHLMMDVGIETDFTMSRSAAKSFAVQLLRRAQLGVLTEDGTKGTAEEVRAYYEARDAATETMDRHVRSADGQARLRNAFAVPLLARFFGRFLEPGVEE